MPTYLLETYLARSQPAAASDAGQRARAAARGLAGEGTPILYLRTMFLPDDETCFHLFDAASADAVAEVGRRAGLGNGRIVQAIEASGPWAAALYMPIEW